MEHCSCDSLLKSLLLLFKLADLVAPIVKLESLLSLYDFLEYVITSSFLINKYSPLISKIVLIPLLSDFNFSYVGSLKLV